ncbi:MAG: NAD(P)-dependent oxidoreductase [Chloroflexi bacterium]|nr:MAG: NAD(P)-dependent oxidoreductase [Chloroflexota bacterium]
MRVLLLGASGFLGRHVDEALTAGPEFEVVRQVHRAAGDHGAISLDLVEAGDSLASLIADTAPDAVVNCVGTTEDRTQLEALNVRLVANLVEVLRTVTPRIRLVHLGSAAEYGPTPEGVPIAESSTARPASPYGAAKLAATALVAASVERGLDGLVLRVFNPIGAGMSPASLPGNAARRLREAMANGSSVVSLGPLGDWRDFLAASDVGGAVVAALRAPGLGEPIVNIGRGEATQVRQVVRQLAVIARFDGEVREDAPPSSRSAAVPWQQADTTLARTRLGWQVRRPLDQALGELWESVADS